jgi:hypothetical protein
VNAEPTPGEWKAIEGRNVCVGEDVTYSVEGPPSDFMYLRNEADALVMAASKELLAVAKRYEAWEAKLILCQKAWEQSVPTFTQALLDEWMEIQGERNAAVRKAERGTT